MVFDLYARDILRTDPEAGIDEILSSFAAFRLKVLEARSLGLDTLKSIQGSVEYYKTQMVSEGSYNGRLLYLEREAYDRLNEEIVVYPIIVPFAYKADTLKAFGKAEEIMQMSGRQPVETIIKSCIGDKEVKADRKPVSIKAFDLPYELECAVYNTPAGEISYPVRTGKGYALFGVLSRKKAPGKFKTSHILAAVTAKSTPEKKRVARMKIDSVYSALRRGVNFDSLAVAFSDDSFSAPYGGELPWLEIRDMDPGYARALLSLSPGDSVSEPFLTPFGWHIVQLHGCLDVPAFEERADEIKKRMELSGRLQAIRQIRMEALKNKYAFAPDNRMLSRLKSFRGDRLQLDRQCALMEDGEGPLFRYDNIPVFLSDFLAYIRETTCTGTLLNTASLFDGYLFSILEDHDRQKMMEQDTLSGVKIGLFRDYLLAQEITAREILSDSITDEVLNRYFKKNKRRYSTVSKQFGGVLVQCADKKIARRVKKQLKRWPENGLKERMLKEFNTDSLPPAIKITDGLFSPGDRPEIDRAVFGLEGAENDPGFSKMLVRGKVVKGEKVPIETLRYQLRIDYLKEREEDWLRRLKVKYPVEIDKDVVKTVNNKN